MNELQYATFVKLMSSEAATKSTHKRRRGYEHVYYKHHHARGIRLRGKYRAP